MELETLLLLVAFRNRIYEPDLDRGLSRFSEIVGRSIGPGEFCAALARALVAGHIHDPVQLPAGALQCHWQLDLTSDGVIKVQDLLQSYGKSLDELIAHRQPSQ